MKNFKCSRFLSYTLSQLRVDYKGFLKSYAIFAAISVIIYIVIMTLTFDGDKTAAFPAVPTMLIIIFSFMWMSKLCKAFKEYHSALSAPRVMMLPASKSEKFLSIVAVKGIVLPLGYAATLVAIVCLSSIFYSGDLLTQVHQTVASIINPQIEYTFSDLGTQIATMHPYHQQLTASSIIMYGLNYLAYSLFMGVIFRRRQFGLAIAIIIAFSLLAILLIIKYIAVTNNPIESIENLYSLINYRYYFELPIITIFFIGAWLKFRSLQIKR